MSERYDVISDVIRLSKYTYHTLEGVLILTNYYVPGSETGKTF